jgi:hypothetical protein
MPRRGAGIDCATNLVPDLGQPLPLIHEHRPGQTRQESGIGGENLSLGRKAQIDDGHGTLRRRRSLPDPLRSEDRQSTQMGLKLIQCVIQDAAPVLDHKATLSEVSLPLAQSHSH